MILPWTKLHSVFSFFTEGTSIHFTKPTNFLWLKFICLWCARRSGHQQQNQFISQQQKKVNLSWYKCKTIYNIFIFLILKQINTKSIIKR